MDFSKLTVYLNEAEENFGVPACECIVYKGHKEIYRHYTGYRDFERTAPICGGEWYWLYSASKIATVAATMQLVESRKLALDAPVSWYLDYFKNMSVIGNGGEIKPAKSEITVRNLLTMTGGFTYNQNSPALLKMREKTENNPTTDEYIRALASEPLAFEPGEHFKYSLCHDALGALIEAVSGERFSRYIERHIFEPLEITGATFHPTREHFDRMPDKCIYDEKAYVVRRDTKNNSHCHGDLYDSGGAGICARAEDYILLLDALACGGVGKNGERILSPKSIEMIRTNQMSGGLLEDFNRMKPYPNGYGLGVRVRLEKDGNIPVGSFGWDGFCGADAAVYPEAGLSICYLQHLGNSMDVWHKLLPTIENLTYEAVLNN